MQNTNTHKNKYKQGKKIIPIFVLLVFCFISPASFYYEKRTNKKTKNLDFHEPFAMFHCLIFRFSSRMDLTFCFFAVEKDASLTRLADFIL